MEAGGEGGGQVGEVTRLGNPFRWVTHLFMFSF